MQLSKKEVDRLLRLLRLTKDEEIDCDQCLSRVAEFVEQELAGRSIPEGLEAVEHHLSVCADCREEYEVLLKALSDMDA